MKTARIITLFLFAACLVVVHCSGGGGGDETPPPPPVNVDQELSKATDELKQGNVTTALGSYDNIIKTDENNSTARFGKALCNLLLLIERAPSTAMLAGFGQGPWTVASVMGPTGYLTTTLTNPKADKSALPFYNTKDCKPHGYWSPRCILSKVAAGYTEEKLAASFNELMPYIDEIVSDLLIAINDTAAKFTIPKELYAGDVDIQVNHADMVEILAGMYLTKASNDMANSWTFNWDLSSIIDAAGVAKITKAQAVAELNKQFGLRSDHRLDSAKTNLQQWASYTKQGLGEILSVSTGGVLNLSDSNKEIYTELADMVDGFIKSFDGGVAVPHIQPEIIADLNKFFSDPANGAEIEFKPFVYENKQIKAVEAYWQAMINTAINFKIGTKNVKVFEESVRSLQYPYYQLFNAIMGHSFGKFKVSTKY